MSRFISATYHSNIKVAEFICDDGRHLLRCGGTLPWRLNNAGDLMSPVDSNGYPAPKKTRNFIGFASIPKNNGEKSSHFFIFPTYEAGREQLEISIKRRHSTRTLRQLVEKYAPPDSNNTEKYIADLVKESRIGSDKVVGDLSETEFEKVVDAIEKLEGYHNEKETRREIWIPVSRITANDGSRPLADEEIILKTNGSETVLKTNQYGQLPPIPHPKGQKVEVLHKLSNGEVKTVGELGGDNGQHFSLKVWIQRFIGLPGPKKEQEVSAKRRSVLVYTVQPGDNLLIISKRFSIPHEQIKIDNHLKRDIIFPGQQLGIYGPLPTGVAKAPAKIKRAELKADPAKKGKSPPPAKVVADQARTRVGTGQPVALVRVEQKMAPWMAIAFREAIQFAGKDEKEITKTHNYHRLITDDDRAGGRITELKKASGKPLLDKSGKPKTRITFDGAADLINTPWCASFVNYCLREAGYPPGRRIASSYTFSEDRDLFVRIKKPVYGAIRFSRRNGGGHVCFVYGVVSDKLVIVGGNQSDELCFQLRNYAEEGSAFFVPVSYKDYADGSSGSRLPEVDFDALKKEFGRAVMVKDADINALTVAAQKEE